MTALIEARRPRGAQAARLRPAANLADSRVAIVSTAAADLRGVARLMGTSWIGRCAATGHRSDAFLASSALPR